MKHETYWLLVQVTTSAWAWGSATSTVCIFQMSLVSWQRRLFCQLSEASLNLFRFSFRLHTQHQLQWKHLSLTVMNCPCQVMSETLIKQACVVCCELFFRAVHPTFLPPTRTLAADRPELMNSCRTLLLGVARPLLARLHGRLPGILPYWHYFSCNIHAKNGASLSKNQEIFFCVWYDGA